MWLFVSLCHPCNELVTYLKSNKCSAKYPSIKRLERPYDSKSSDTEQTILGKCNIPLYRKSYSTVWIYGEAGEHLLIDSCRKSHLALVFL